MKRKRQQQDIDPRLNAIMFGTKHTVAMIGGLFSFFCDLLKAATDVSEEYGDKWRYQK